MPRPIAFDRFTFIDDVMNLIHLIGYEAASVKLICEFTGITRSSFYNAFGTREKLFAELLAHQEMLGFDTAFKLATPPVNVKMLITSVVMSMVEEIADDPALGCFFANAIAERAGRDVETTFALSQRLAKQIDKLEEILNWGVSTKQLPRHYDCRAAALAVQNAMLGAALSARLIKDKRQLALMVTTSLRGLGLFDEEFATPETV
jgi:TetR/AcrR family transcriptional repressor of nem operon